MATVSFRVSDELKEKMDEHGEINWSAVSNLASKANSTGWDHATLLMRSPRASDSAARSPTRTWWNEIRQRPSTSGERCDTGLIRTVAEIVVESLSSDSSPSDRVASASSRGRRWCDTDGCAVSECSRTAIPRSTVERLATDARRRYASSVSTGAATPAAGRRRAR